MVALAKTLATAIAGTGVQAGVDLAALSRSVTMQVVVAGTTPDNAVVVELDGSLDNVNWTSLGQKVGPGMYSNDGDVIQYVRANIVQQQAGSTCTVSCGFTPG
jgi:hypothetical protein